ncbi:MAG: retropepsin-like aspartic protease [Gemmataceae bacterium]|nr:retropepsin-like domain-containing protein [Gemmata sp.]MDW8197590.1 retropepsin-like aspartic protease [Gemmataceae bacterium]
MARISSQCALDTASTFTVLPAPMLRRLGYDGGRPVHRTRLRTATGGAPVPMIEVQTLVALEQVRSNFVVAAHDLPLGVVADGLLGLDFFRERTLTRDFSYGRITLTSPRWRAWLGW